jgi:uncharacterized membrane protein
MPFWGGYWWGQPWGGFGWIFPLIGMLFMVVMVFVCIRMMGGMLGGGGCMGGHRGRSADQADDLRREIQELKEEVRKLRDRS